MKNLSDDYQLWASGIPKKKSIYSMEDAKKLAEYDGLVEMNKLLLIRLDGILSLFKSEGMSYSADSLEEFLKGIKK